MNTSNFVYLIFFIVCRFWYFSIKETTLGEIYTLESTSHRVGTYCHCHYYDC